MALGFCYVLCRDLGRSRVASLVGGAVFALGGYIGNTAWPQKVNGAVWLPLVFLFLLRAGRGEQPLRNAIISGAFVGASWLSGYHQVPFLYMLAAGGAWLYFIFRAGRPDWRMARAAAAAFLFTFLTGALQILPAYEYGHLANRWVGAPEPVTWNQPVPYAVQAIYDLKPFELLGIVFPWFQMIVSPFVGVVALALAMLGLAAGWRDARAKGVIPLLAAVGVGGLVYAVGQHSVFQGLLYAVVPELDKARSASTTIVLFEFAVAVVAAFGLDAVGQALPWPRRVMWAACGFGLFTLGVFQIIFFANKWSFPGLDNPMLTPFVALAFAALLFASLRGALSRHQCGVLMLVLVLLELGNNPGSAVIMPRTDRAAMKWLNQIRGDGDVAEFLKRQEPFPRANLEGDPRLENWGTFHGVEMSAGYLASLTTNLMSFDNWTLPSRLLWGVGYTIRPTPGPEGQLVFTGASGWKVYRHQEVSLGRGPSMS
jgi:hypothetical protein